MAQTVLITLTVAGADSGPYNIYSNVDGYVTPFETGIDKASLLAGFTSYTVPDSTTIIRVQSAGVQCSNFINLTIQPSTTTTTTSSTSSTTTTTTTIVPSEFDFYLADQFSCGTCNLQTTNLLVRFPSGTSVFIGNYYQTSSPADSVYRINSTSGSGVGSILLATIGNNSSCVAVPCLT